MPPGGSNWTELVKNEVSGVSWRQKNHADNINYWKSTGCEITLTPLIYLMPAEAATRHMRVQH